MRYELNQELFAVQFVTAMAAANKDIGLYVKPLMFNNHIPVLINFTKLVVAEHHKVPNEWDPEGAEPKYDGYLLKDEKDTVFANQYPRASYGQISDAGNRRFNIHETDKTDANALFEQLKNNPEMAYEYNLLTDTLESVRKGIDDLENIPVTDEFYPQAQEKARCLKIVLELTVEQFGKKYPDYQIVLEKKPAFGDTDLMWWTCNISKIAQ